MSNEKTLRVLFADDHNLVRNGIISLLDNVHDIEIAGEAENGQTLVDLYFKTKPDVVVSDISMPGMSGPEAVKIILEKDPDAKVLFLSVYEGDEYVFQALEAGALGLVNKSILKAELVEAIKTISTGSKYFGNGYTDERLDDIYKKYSLARQEALSDKVQLTQRELEVLQLICDGFSSQEIADKLFLSKKTVDTHRGNLIKKFGVSSSAQLVKIAFQQGII